MRAKNLINMVFVVCLISTVSAQEQTKAPAIKVDTAVRITTIIDPQGEEGRCTADSSSTCLVLSVSGIEPNKLVDIWINKEKGGVLLKAGTEQYDISTIKTNSKSKHSIIEVTVPKDAKEFSLCVADAPPTLFKVGAVVLEKYKEADLFK